ncbi:response regulator [Leptospira wolffii]|uniref:Response regulator n=1 Tax=Leptospira wolffii TaxID=409998 RepID=A0ABV5BM58_9LEPT
MSFESPKILILEDENIVARDLCFQLERIGYTSVRVVKTGEEALARVLEERPDLLILDITLSRGELDGIETGAEIHTFSDIPIIYLTAYANESTWTRTKETKPYGYILKPFQIQELKIAIEMALNKSAWERKRHKERDILSSVLGDSVLWEVQHDAVRLGSEKDNEKEEDRSSKNSPLYGRKLLNELG